jgi:hypothetical protein
MHVRQLSRALCAQGAEREYRWLSMKAQVALLLSLRAVGVLAQYSAGREREQGGETALFYADAGLKLLLECEAGAARCAGAHRCSSGLCLHPSFGAAARRIARK